MRDLTATAVIEARFLVRAALVSLMEAHSYKVICSIGSPAHIDRNSLTEEQPKLVMLGALSAGRLADATNSIRKCWQGAKIIKLLDDASSMDLQEVLASDVDACIPMDASPRAMIDTLQLMGSDPLRVIVVSGTLPDSEQTLQNEAAFAAEVASCLTAPFAVGMPCAGDLGAAGAVDAADSDYRLYALSEREEQILKTLVRGYSNKMIGRLHSVTEATIKAHMKTILRKIGAANRTQAAIWALKNGGFPGEPSDDGESNDPRQVRLVNGHSS